ncbi:MAG TPA: serine protease [Caulobacteraceae bacterium]|nr:serine protease [Caulobacteraceae bacterium]
MPASAQTPNDAPPMPGAPEHAPAAAAPAAAPPAAATPAGDFQPVAFTRLAVRLPVGEPWMTMQSGMFCNPYRTSTWPGGQSDYQIRSFQDPFRTEFLAAGLKMEGDPNNLFETTTNSADFAIAGVIVALDQKFCAKGSGTMGSVDMTVEWQLYSRLQKQVVATVRTSGQSQSKEARQGGSQILLIEAFTQSVHQLAASPELRKALAGTARGETELVRPTASAPISLTAAPALPGVEAAVKSVVLVRAGGTEGTGVLVSRDGYILTAAHVVGDAPAVKIRWSDGKEAPGEVVRISKGRDVALIKVDPGLHAPLPLRRDEPPVGDPVFAVGALFGERFQSSVTRGVMSADRNFDGYAYIQSDVVVDPGASGGPLLDSQGRVIGLTVLGVRPGGLPSGINLFVPTRDAMDFLSLAVK